MKDTAKTLNYKGRDLKVVFNLNVMQEIQEEYETIEKWGELTDGTVKGESDAKAIIFGYMKMLNEGIDIDNEENGTDEKPLTKKQVGRIISEIGLEEVARIMNSVVVDSTQSAEKNA